MIIIFSAESHRCSCFDDIVGVYIYAVMEYWDTAAEVTNTTMSYSANSIVSSFLHLPFSPLPCRWLSRRNSTEASGYGPLHTIFPCPFTNVVWLSLQFNIQISADNPTVSASVTIPLVPATPNTVLK